MTKSNIEVFRDKLKEALLKSFICVCNEVSKKRPPIPPFKAGGMVSCNNNTGEFIILPGKSKIIPHDIADKIIKDCDIKPIKIDLESISKWSKTN